MWKAPLVRLCFPAFGNCCMTSRVKQSLGFFPLSKLVTKISFEIRLVDCSVNVRCYWLDVFCLGLGYFSVGSDLFNILFTFVVTGWMRLRCFGIHGHVKKGIFTW